jgi:hypothetical protein
MSICYRIGLSLLAIVVLGASEASAQIMEPISEGQLARVQFAGDVMPTQGVLRQSPIGWALTTDDGQTRVLDADDLQRIEAGVRHRSPWKGVAVGGGVGLLVGLSMNALGDADCTKSDFLGFCGAAQDATTSTELLVIPLVGAAVGGVIKSLLGSTRWTPAVAPTGTPGESLGVGFGWSLSVR